MASSADEVTPPPPAAPPTTATKVLLSGAVDGKLKALFKRVEAVNKSNGPFDCLLCTGRFFADGPPTAEDLGEMREYLTGALHPPVPVYFIGGYGQGSIAALAALVQETATAAGPDAAPAPPRLHYLGQSGVAVVAGLRVAFLDGAAPGAAGDPGAYTDAAVIDTLSAAAHGAGCGTAPAWVDILLTCEWPRGVTDGVSVAAGTAAALPERCMRPTAGGVAPTLLARRLAPRYHVSGGEVNVFFGRSPYRNEAPAAHVTRFLGLAATSNTAKAKSLHALAVTAAARMPAATLATVPGDATPSPYAPPPPQQHKRGPPPSTAGEPPLEDMASWRWQAPKRPRRVSGDGAAGVSWGTPGLDKDHARTVHVSSSNLLPFGGVTQDDIKAYFGACGVVEDVRRFLDDAGRLRGWLHVQFAAGQPGAVTAALALTGGDLGGRPVSISPAMAFRDARPVTAQDSRPATACWFCLSNPGVDSTLVVSIGHSMYVAVDKGPVVPLHCLVVPIDHAHSTLDLSQDAADELGRYATALRSCYADAGCEAFAFERFLTLRGKPGGNHAHVAMAPFPRADAPRARGVITAAASRAGITLVELPPPPDGAHGVWAPSGREALRALVGSGEYFVAILPGGSRLVHVIQRGERHPFNFGREVMAALAGCPERADWRACQTDSAGEDGLREAFKAAFDPFDTVLASA